MKFPSIFSRESRSWERGKGEGEGERTDDGINRRPSSLEYVETNHPSDRTDIRMINLSQPISLRPTHPHPSQHHPTPSQDHQKPKQ